MQTKAKKVVEAGANKKKNRPTKSRRRRGPSPKNKVSAEKHSLIRMQKLTGLSFDQIKEWQATGVSPKRKRCKPTAKELKQLAHQKRQEDIKAAKKIGAKGPKPPQHFPKREYEKKPPGEKKVFHPNHLTIVTFEQIKIGERAVTKEVPMTLEEVRKYCIENAVDLTINVKNLGVANFNIPFFEIKDGEKVPLNVFTPRLYPRRFMGTDGSYFSPAYDPKQKGKAIWKYDKAKGKRIIIGYKKPKNPLYSLEGVIDIEEFLQLEYLAGLRPDATALGRLTLKSKCNLFKYLGGKVPLTKKVQVLDSKNKPIIEDIFKTVRKHDKVSRVLEVIPVRELIVPHKVAKKERKPVEPLVSISNGKTVHRVDKLRAAEIMETHNGWKYVDKTTWKDAKKKGNAGYGFDPFTKEARVMAEVEDKKRETEKRIKTHSNIIRRRVEKRWEKHPRKLHKVGKFITKEELNAKLDKKLKLTSKKKKVEKPEVSKKKRKVINKSPKKKGRVTPKGEETFLKV